MARRRSVALGKRLANWLDSPVFNVLSQFLSTWSSGMPRIVFFGDSICVGQGVSIHKGWVTRIAARISEIGERHGADLVVVNASVNGNTTRQALERMPYDVQSHGADILIVQFGMNDCNYWQSDRGLPRVSPDSFRANLDEIIDRGFKFGAKHVLVNTNHPTLLNETIFPLTNLTYEESNQRYNEVIRSVSNSANEDVSINDIGLEFRIKIEDEDARHADLLLEDRLHLSANGHDLYYRLIAPVVEQSLFSCLGIGAAGGDSKELI